MSKKKPVFDNPLSRSLASMVGTLASAVLITGGAPLYLPFSQTDNIGLPILLFPVTWLLLFLYSTMCDKVLYAWLLIVGLSSLHAALIYTQLF